MPPAPSRIEGVSLTLAGGQGEDEGCRRSRPYQYSLANGYPARHNGEFQGVRRHNSVTPKVSDLDNLIDLGSIYFFDSVIQDAGPLISYFLADRGSPD